MKTLLIAVILSIFGSFLAAGGDMASQFPQSVDIPAVTPEVVVKDSIELVRVSAYNAVPAQTSADPTTSSCGPTQPGQIAVSQDLFFKDGRKHLCGTTVTLITDSGWVFPDVVIWDTMNSRFTDTADVLFWGTDQEAVQMARQFGVTTGRIIF